MRVDQLVNFALGDDNLDRWQIKLLQDNVSLAQWCMHISHYVIPAYRRHRHQPRDGLTNKHLEEAAIQLRAKYRRAG